MVGFMKNKANIKFVSGAIILLLLLSCSPIVSWAQDGTEKWHFTTGGDVYSSPAIGTDGTIYVGSNDNNLYAINPDGTYKWHFTTGGWLT
jgi:outer membrane protein assembly factor BamB